MKDKISELALIITNQDNHFYSWEDVYDEKIERMKEVIFRIDKEEKVSNSTSLEIWEKATNDLAQQFANKYFDGGEWYWIGDQIGGVYCIADYFFILDRIIEALELRATYKQLIQFYDYELQCHEKDEAKTINFKNFVKYGFFNK